MSNVIITGTSGKSGTLSQVFDKSRRDPVGTIRQSILSESQFQLKAGDGWVRADGRLISTTTYSALFGFIGYAYGGSGATFRIPNMQDRYSRMSGTYSLGSCQGNTTHLGSLGVTVGAYQTQYVDPGNGLWTNTGGVIQGSPCNHSHSAGDSSVALRYRNGHLYWRPNIGNSYSTDTRMVVSLFPFPATTQGSFTGQGMRLSGATGTASNPNGTDNIGLTTTAVTISGSDPETRPETIVLNWFIKIK